MGIKANISYVRLKAVCIWSDRGIALAGNTFSSPFAECNTGMGDGVKRERERNRMRKRTRRQSSWSRQGEARERQDEHSRCLT